MMRWNSLANPQVRGVGKAADREEPLCSVARRDEREAGRRTKASFPQATGNMAPQRVMRAVRRCRRGYVALSALAAGLATLTSPSLAFGKPFQGLDLVDDLTQETIQNMRTIMVRYKAWGRGGVLCLMKE